MKFNSLLLAIILLSSCKLMPREEKKAPVPEPATAEKFKRAWWKEAIVYQIHLSGFKQAEGRTGKIADIAARLDYFQDLGFNAIWLHLDSSRAINNNPEANGKGLEQTEELISLRNALKARNMELVTHKRFMPNSPVPGWLAPETTAMQDSLLLSLGAKEKEVDWLRFKQYQTEWDRAMGEAGWRHIRLASPENPDAFGYLSKESAAYRDALATMRQTLLFTQRATPVMYSGNQPGQIAEVQQMADSNSVLNHTRRLIRLRRNNPLLVYGSFQEIDPGNTQVFAYTRSLGTERWLILLNLSSITQPFEVPGSLTYQSAEKIMGNYERDDKAYERTWLLLPYFAGIYKLK